jgi:hypothetical protein
MRLPVRLVGAVTLFAAAPFVAAQTPTPPPRPAPEAAPVGGTESLAPRTQIITRIDEPIVTIMTAESAPQPLGYESDVYCFGYLAASPESFSGRIMGAENIAEQIDFIDHDLLYVDGGHDRGFEVGGEYWLITPEQEVLHPVSGQSLGRFHQYRGRGMIAHVEARSSIMRVTQSCTDIPLGSYLKPFEPVPIPLGRKTPLVVAGDPPSGRVTGHIIFTPEGIVSLGADHTILVNLGHAEGVEAGDFMTVYRYARGRPAGREIGDVGANWVKVKESPLAGAAEVPRTYLGELSVLFVGERWSVARITDVHRLIEVGDEVELKAK